MDSIHISLLSKAFGEKAVLSDFSATLKAGGAYALMGASGVGKTTLLRILLSLESKDSGEITGLPSRIAAVFQEERLIPTLSAVDNLRFALKDVALEKIEATLSSLGLADSLNAPVSTLSGGMRRRVSLARALLFDAPFLLFDEPFKGLDEETRRVVIDVINRYTKGKTLIVSTHDIRDAKDLNAEIFNL